MGKEILNIDKISVSVEDKEILHSVSLSINEGETHVLMGPNGAGKSTLGNALMGNPKYEVTGGSVTFNGEDLLDMDTAKRAQAGLFMTFQNAVEVPGISLADFLRSAYEQKGQKIGLFQFQKILKEKMEILQMDSSYMKRGLNVGFSGGEKKKSEIFQLLVLQPKLAILDETDSGLDVDAVKIVSSGVDSYLKSQGGSLLIITHSPRLLQSLSVDKVHVMKNGKIVASGGSSLIKDIDREGFEHYLR